MFKDFHLVAVGIGDEGHFFTILELLTPVLGPEIDFEVKPFKHFAICDDVIHADAGVDQIFRKFDLEVRGVGQLQFMAAAGNLKVCQLIAAGRLIGPFEDFKTAGPTIPLDGLFQIRDTNTGVVEGDVHPSSLQLLAGNVKRENEK